MSVLATKSHQELQDILNTPTTSAANVARLAYGLSEMFDAVHKLENPTR